MKIKGKIIFKDGSENSFMDFERLEHTPISIVLFTDSITLGKNKDGIERKFYKIREEFFYDSIKSINVENYDITENDLKKMKKGFLSRNKSNLKRKGQNPSFFS